MPEAAILTSTSPSLGGSSSMVSTFQSPPISQRIAASVCIVVPSLSHPVLPGGRGTPSCSDPVGSFGSTHLPTSTGTGIHSAPESLLPQGAYAQKRRCGIGPGRGPTSGAGGKLH